MSPRKSPPAANRGAQKITGRVSFDAESNADGLDRHVAALVAAAPALTAGQRDQLGRLLHGPAAPRGAFCCASLGAEQAQELAALGRFCGPDRCARGAR